MTELDRDAVAAKAFALYVRRGRQPGKAIDDWLEAERQTRAELEGRGQPGPASKSITGFASASGKTPPASFTPTSRPIPAPLSPARTAPAQASSSTNAVLSRVNAPGLQGTTTSKFTPPASKGSAPVAAKPASTSAKAVTPPSKSSGSTSSGGGKKNKKKR